MNPQPTHQHQLIVAEKVQLGFEQPLFEPISFTLHRGDRIAIVGENGSGKSTLIRALLGQFNGISRGLLKLAPVSLSLVRQQYADNRGTLPDFAETHQLSREALLNNLRKLGMPRADFATPIEHLSMGQQKKVEVARSWQRLQRFTSGTSHLIIWIPTIKIRLLRPSANINQRCSLSNTMNILSIRLPQR